LTGVGLRSGFLDGRTGDLGKGGNSANGANCEFGRESEALTPLPEVLEGDPHVQVEGSGLLAPGKAGGGLSAMVPTQGQG